LREGAASDNLLFIQLIIFATKNNFLSFTKDALSVDVSDTVTKSLATKSQLAQSQVTESQVAESVIVAKIAEYPRLIKSVIKLGFGD
jgi:hypothetical protein